MKKLVENKTTRKINEVVNFPEIRSGRIRSGMSDAGMSNFKKGIAVKLNEEIVKNLVIELNTLHVDLGKFAKKEVSETDAYLKELLDIADKPELNWAQLCRNVEANVSMSPNTSMVRWSYYNSTHKVKVDPKGEFVARYREFFEQMRYELKLLSKKLRIEVDS